MSDEKTEGRFAYEGIDRVIHEKARLSIVASLASQPDGLQLHEHQTAQQRLGQARVLFELGLMHEQRSESEAAQEFFERALPPARSAGDPASRRHRRPRLSRSATGLG